MWGWHACPIAADEDSCTSACHHANNSTAARQEWRLCTIAGMQASMFECTFESATFSSPHSLVQEGSGSVAVVAMARTHVRHRCSASGRHSLNCCASHVTHNTQQAMRSDAGHAQIVVQSTQGSPVNCVRCYKAVVAAGCLCLCASSAILACSQFPQRATVLTGPSKLISSLT